MQTWRACYTVQIVLFLLGVLLLGTELSTALSGCNQQCSTGNDCQGQLTCISNKCNDDPSVGTHICGESPPPPSPDSGICKPYQYMSWATVPSGCNTGQLSSCCTPGQKYALYKCSPTVTSSTKGILTLNSFQSGGSGGAPSACDGQFHNDQGKWVALSTGWYNGGSRCMKKIHIKGNGRNTTATVVDECDTQHGCDSVHAYQPPCPYNDVDASAAIWTALGVSSSDDQYGMMDITWSDA